MWNRKCLTALDLPVIWIAHLQRVSPLLELDSSKESIGCTLAGVTGGKELTRAHTSHACHLCEGQTWAPLHSDFILTHRCSKEESNITQHHFPNTSSSGIKGSSLVAGEAVMKAPASSQQGSLCVWVHCTPLWGLNGCPQMQVSSGFLLARGRNTLTVGRIKLFLASNDYPSYFPREEMNLQLIMTFD